MRYKDSCPLRSCNSVIDHIDQAITTIMLREGGGGGEGDAHFDMNPLIAEVPLIPKT